MNNAASVLLASILPLFLVLGLWIGALYDQRCSNVLYKLDLLRAGIGHMMFSTDKKFPKKATLPSIKAKDFKKIGEKRIVFVRHAESAWNEVFNKGFKLVGDDSFPKRVLNAVTNEAKMFPTLDSVFIDAPLSKYGTNQIQELRQFVNTEIEQHFDDNESICLVSSNLRRAISTAAIGFWDKLTKGSEKDGKCSQLSEIKILSSLQEVTFNVDGISLAKPGMGSQLSQTELAALDIQSVDDFPSEILDAEANAGNKEIRSCGMDRLVDFSAWCMDQEEDTIIAAGHSLYFRYFFQYFLDAEDSHEAKKLKMENAAVVSFVLEQGTSSDKNGNSKTWYRIDESTLKPLFLGFEAKKKKNV